MRTGISFPAFAACFHPRLSTVGSDQLPPMRRGGADGFLVCEELVCVDRSGISAGDCEGGSQCQRSVLGLLWICR